MGLSHSNLQTEKNVLSGIIRSLVNIPTLTPVPLFLTQLTLELMLVYGLIFVLCINLIIDTHDSHTTRLTISQLMMTADLLCLKLKQQSKMTSDLLCSKLEDWSVGRRSTWSRGA